MSDAFLAGRGAMRALGMLMIVGILSGCAAPVSDGDSQLRTSVEDRLHADGYMVDASTLSDSQVARLHLALDSKDDPFDPLARRARIEAILNQRT